MRQTNYEFLKGLPDEDLKEFIGLFVDELAELKDPKKVKEYLDHRRQIFDFWERGGRQQKPDSKEMLTPKKLREREKVAKESSVLDVQLRMIDIIHCQEILESRGIRHKIDISGMPPNLQRVFVAIYENRSGKKFVYEKPPGKLRGLGRKALGLWPKRPRKK